MRQGSDHLFVYGTLRKGFSLHSFLGNREVRFVGYGRIPGLLYDLGEFPGAVPAASGGEVEGELYELLGGEAQLKKLDALEEFYPEKPQQSLFFRRSTFVTLRNGAKVEAWAYFVSQLPPEARIVPSGDYAEARRSR